MAETVILENFAFSGTSIENTTITVPLEFNTLYRVVYDGEEYQCASYFFDGFAIGKTKRQGMNYPFGLAANLGQDETTGEDVVIAGFRMIVDTDGEHTLSIYKIGKVDTEKICFYETSVLTEFGKFSESDSGWAANFLSANAVATVGEEYAVYIEGNQYICKSFEYTEEGMTATVIGNAKYTGGEDTGEPFVTLILDGSIAQTPGAIIFAVLFSSELLGSGTDGETKIVNFGIELAQITNVVLKDRNGQPTEYAGVKKIKVNMSDGTTSLWIDETTVPTPVATEVELNLANGNQTITPSSGQVFNSVEIIKPADLLPGNILKNKNIGGVLGTYEAPEEMTVTITPDFSGGNVTEVPETGKVFNEVIVVKPETLLDQNIKKNVAVAGITGGLNYIETVTTASGMDAVLVEGNEGNVYKYTGATTDNYTSGDIYIVEAVT